MSKQTTELRQYKGDQTLQYSNTWNKALNIKHLCNGTMTTKFLDQSEICEIFKFTIS